MQNFNAEKHKTPISNDKMESNDQNDPNNSDNSDIDQMDSQTIIERYSLKQWKLPKVFRIWKRNKSNFEQSNTLFGNEVKLVGSSVFYNGEINDKHVLRSMFNLIFIY